MNLFRSALAAALVAAAGVPYSAHAQVAQAQLERVSERAADRGAAEHTIAPLVERLRPTVVNIQALHGAKGGDDGRSLGSGFVLDPSGLVVTNAHVIEGATDVRVVLWDKRTLRARVVGKDARTDLALLKVERAKDLPSVTFGDSDAARVGDVVIAIGNPFGLGSSVTSGILSATERHLGTGPYDELLQTDAPINPGSSGGPLFNARGEVIGISTAIVENGQGIGFAVPANVARQVIGQLKAKGYVTRGYLGVDIQDLTPELATAFDAPSVAGALVAHVDDGSPAARAGLRVGDVIVGFGDRAIETSARLPRYVSQTEPGRRVVVAYLRDGKRLSKEVTVERLKDEGKPELVRTAAAATRPRAIGIDVEARGKEVLVTRVDPSGLLGASLATGDIILDVDRAPVRSKTDLEAAVKKHGKSGTPLLLRVRRGETTVFVPVDL